MPIRRIAAWTIQTAVMPMETCDTYNVKHAPPEAVGCATDPLEGLAEQHYPKPCSLLTASVARWRSLRPEGAKQPKRVLERLHGLGWAHSDWKDAKSEVVRNAFRFLKFF